MLRCVLKNLFKSFGYMILCKNTNGINILAIQIPLIDSHRVQQDMFN